MLIIIFAKIGNTERGPQFWRKIISIVLAIELKVSLTYPSKRSRRHMLYMFRMFRGKVREGDIY